MDVATLSPRVYGLAAVPRAGNGENSLSLFCSLGVYLDHGLPVRATMPVELDNVRARGQILRDCVHKDVAGLWPGHPAYLLADPDPPCVYADPGNSDLPATLIIKDTDRKPGAHPAGDHDKPPIALSHGHAVRILVRRGRGHRKLFLGRCELLIPLLDLRFQFGDLALLRAKLSTRIAYAVAPAYR